MNNTFHEISVETNLPRKNTFYSLEQIIDNSSASTDVLQFVSNVSNV